MLAARVSSNNFSNCLTFVTAYIGIVCYFERFLSCRPLTTTLYRETTHDTNGHDTNDAWQFLLAAVMSTPAAADAPATSRVRRMDRDAEPTPASRPPLRARNGGSASVGKRTLRMPL